MARIRSVLIVALAASLVSTCGPAGAAPTPTGSAAGSPQSSTLAVGSAAPTPAPTKPIAAPRPTDLPSDGSCETANTSCLGLLTAQKAYRTQVFQPTVTLAVPTVGWENRAEDGGAFELLSITSPGDVIAFFGEPRAPDPTVGPSVDDLARWLVHDASLQVTPPKAVKVGGLNGVTLDLRVAPGATNADPGCPVQVCVPIFSGHDPNSHDFYPWSWDWGAAGAETQRLYLLTWAKGVIAVFVDSLDGTTFDAMTRTFDSIRPTLRFG